MARKRNYIQEILNINWRMHRRGSRWEKFSRRLTPLLNARDALDNSKIDLKQKQELYRYFPIAMIAAMEGYFKIVYRQLIDYGQPYSANALGFKDLKFEIAELLAISGGIVSSGQLVAHLLPHKSIYDINRNMSTLLGEDFFGEFKKQKIPFIEDDILIEEIFPYLKGGVQSTFEIRHLFCHELGTKVRPSIKHINEMFEMSGWFVLFTEIYLENTFDKAAT
ncbi:MAG TPA: hypothetical protein VFQ47_00070 [Nitrososphaera sp.]|jgi:hypothetical protein|nr:hypothetical protein [Nitrososphaera sp.]